MEARVRGVLEVSSGDVRVTLDADPGPRPRLGEIRVASSGRTHERMVRRAIQVRPGEIIRPRELAETRARLSELGTFSSVDVRTVPVPGKDGVRDLEVSYVERPDVELEYGLRYNYAGSGTSSQPTSEERRAERPERGEAAGGGGPAAREPLRPRLALRRLHAPDERAAQLPARARGAHPPRPAREDAAPGLRRDRRRQRSSPSPSRARSGASASSSRGRSLRDTRQPPLARAAAPAVGLHEQGHPVQRGDRQPRHHRREPRLPQPGRSSGTSATR